MPEPLKVDVPEYDYFDRWGCSTTKEKYERSKNSKWAAAGEVLIALVLTLGFFAVIAALVWSF